MNSLKFIRANGLIWLQLCILNSPYKIPSTNFFILIFCKHKFCITFYFWIIEHYFNIFHFIIFNRRIIQIINSVYYILTWFELRICILTNLKNLKKIVYLRFYNVTNLFEMKVFFLRLSSFSKEENLKI